MKYSYKKRQDNIYSVTTSWKNSLTYTRRYFKASVYKLKKLKISFATCVFAIVFCLVLGGIFANHSSINIFSQLAPANANENNYNTASVPADTALVTIDDNETAVLPRRTMKNDDQGRQVIEVQDPASWELANSLRKVDSVPDLRDVDKRAVDLAKAYDNAKEAPKPFIEPNNGRINFYFGTMVPRIVCRPLRMTDIELEPGERVTGLNIADNSRWSIASSTSGTLDMLTTHIIVKPHLPKISTNLLIHSDRRTYAIELVSVEEGQYMPFIGFLYPASPSRIGAETEEAWEKLMKEYRNSDEYSSETKAYSFNAADPKNINLEYTIKVTRGNNVPWKPKHVYDINGKTYIVMNPNMKFSEAPVIFEKKDNSEKLMNYRVHGDIYIIDRLFDIAIMTAGKDRVVITRKTPLSSTSN